MTSSPEHRIPGIQLEDSPTSEPEWSQRLLENMSSEDQQTVQKLRRSFEKRGKNQQWYYAGAGTDIEPVLIAPTDTTHYFVDPNDEMGSEYWEKRLADSWLRDTPLEVSNTHENTVRSSLEGGGGIVWQGQPAESAPVIPDQLDAIYTNGISIDPSPHALDKLRVHGFMVLNGYGTPDKILNHPTAVRPLSEMGIVPLVNDVAIKQLNPADSQSLLNYSYGRRRTIHVYEKTRAFTPAEQVDLVLNANCLHLHYALRYLLYRFLDHQPVEAEEVADIQGAVTKVIVEFQNDLDKRIPPDAKAKAIERFNQHFGYLLLDADASAAKLVTWQIAADAKVDYYSFDQLQPNQVPQYTQALEPVFQHAQQLLRNIH